MSNKKYFLFLAIIMMSLISKAQITKSTLNLNQTWVGYLN